ncbi:MAG: ABC transporter substrate-binding protein [Candidatus Devosia phytovorans]|uniref:ABC transporter substrate-binding protein n=1 Tax=Candidatus Devosia phytovorans TaxID=3121372 RepID=A0AAJ6AYD3_9HYPH|nr:ABC transporter substrate-binding protein [Devosia sp.]WEK03455.1 MAG: ABC transporter substrate-binding protein [Devosia sp.]
MNSMVKAAWRLGALALVLQAGTAIAADDVAFQLDWTPGGISAAYYLGAEKGCFTDQDINVTISRGYGAADAVTKVATGVADFSVTDLGVIIGAIGETQAPVKSIMPVVSLSPLAIAVLDDSPIQTMNDLEGRKLGSSVGNAALEYVPYGMELAGADYAKVEEVLTDGSALNGLLLGRQIDALASYITSAVQIQSLAAQNGMSVRTVFYGDQLDIYNASVFTSNEMIASNPDLVSRFKKAVQCSYEASVADPAAAVDAIVAGVEGMIRETQTESVPFAMDFSFGPDNAVFAANGFNWDADRVQHNIEVVGKVHDKTYDLTADDVVYTPAE